LKPLRNHADAIRRRLTVGIARPAELCAFADISQPTFWRTLQTLRDEILSFGATRAICYALRDRARTADIPVYRVDEAGNTHHVGVLIAVKPEGFLLQETGGKSQHSDGLPWWLDDMRPQGYLGRVWAQQHAHALALSPHLSDWQHEPACILRALLQEGDDLPGNLLLGDAMRARFHDTPVSPALSLTARRQHYVQLAQHIASGNIPASSVAGEQPKFTTYAMTAQGARHLIVKFSELPENEVTERWRDLLLAEYHALQTLGAAGIAAAETSILDHGGQRFLEIVRFDRVNAKGRLALHSLTALDAAALRQARQNIGMVFQQFNLLSNRTVADNVAFPLEIAGWSSEKIKERVKECLEIVGLTERADHYPAQLSGGQKQRVGISRALAPKPQVILADEPTSALDPATTRSVLECLEDINKRFNVTIVIVTHEMSVIRRLCDRAALLDKGKVVEIVEVRGNQIHAQSEIGRELIRED